MSHSDTWSQLVASSILGTGRQSPALGTGADAGTDTLGALLGEVARSEPERVILAGAAVLSLYRLAGASSTNAEGEPRPVAEPDPLPRCSPRATLHLESMLEGRCRPALPEWLEALAKAGRRLPEEHLPTLLGMARSSPDLWTRLEPVLGERGRWLAIQNPDWQRASAPASEEEWETGTTASRVALIRSVRTGDPDRTRALVESTWDQEPADVRSRLLETFATGLGPADEPLLERALDDRRKEVRTIATDLLPRLPGSAYSLRMEARLDGCIEVGRKLWARTLAVRPPESCDPSMVRDGIEAKPPQGGGAVGERSWWLLQIVGRAPLDYWQRRWELSPDRWIELAEKSDWKEVLLSGWATAAARDGGSEWVQALLASDLAAGRKQPLWSALGPSERDRHLRELLRVPQNLRGEERILPYLAEHERPWSVELSQLVLDAVRHCASLPESRGYRDYQVRAMLQSAAYRVPAGQLAAYEAGWPREHPQWRDWSQSVDEFLSIVQFRSEMLEEIAR